MESIKTTLAEVAKKWRGPYEAEDEIADNILGQAARFVSNLFMPDLNPIMVAVCCYARVTQNEEKVNAVIDTMKQLNELALHIVHYGELLEILDWVESRRLALAADEERKEVAE